MAKWKPSERGPFFQILNRDVIRLIAKNYLGWDFNWGHSLVRKKTFYSFCFWLTIVPGSVC